MGLKNALAVCLIALCSAALVVLIARSLDSQAASQLEPQLTEIAEQLRAIRKEGGLAPAGAHPREQQTDDGLVVYYFHSNMRCANCRAVESQAQETLEAGFSPQLDRGEIVWKVLNYEKPAGAELARRFEVTDPVVVLVRMKDNRVQTWRRLDKVLGLAGDKAALAGYLRGEIEQMLAPAGQPPASPPHAEAPKIPIPAAPATPSKEPPPIPVPEHKVS